MLFKIEKKKKEKTEKGGNYDYLNISTKKKGILPKDEILRKFFQIPIIKISDKIFNNLLSSSSSSVETWEGLVRCAGDA